VPFILENKGLNWLGMATKKGSNVEMIDVSKNWFGELFAACQKLFQEIVLSSLIGAIFLT
jgi:hypothetical protein